MAEDLMEKLVALCKRRGFIFQSSEIYGGINGFWDYGPLGVELKRNVKEAWWQDIVRSRDDMVGLDCAIIMNPKVWEASGHATGFNDPRVDCLKCNARFRADKVYVGAITAAPIENVASAAQAPWVAVAKFDRLLAFGVEADSLDDALDQSQDVIQRLAKKQNIVALKAAQISSPPQPPCGTYRTLAVHGQDVAYAAWIWPVAAAPCGNQRPCPICGGELTETRQFNLMFKSHAGAMEDSSSEVYLRPETAQGIFANFKNVLDTTRLKLPFGIAQIGKSFRNEITPRNYIFRSREFEQMEIEFFCRAQESQQWYEYWRNERYQWYVHHGLTSSKLRLREHEKDELAHYASGCADIEYAFPFGISELEGVANRGDFDLSQHQKFSGKDLTYFDDETKERFLPHVIEPSGGVDRATLAFLCEAYTEDTAPDEKGVPQTRVVMKFHPRLAPIKLAVFPLVKKEGMPEIAMKIHQAAKKAGLASFYDEKSAVGRRYRRQDEAGTPFCVTVDGQTLTDQTVTIRDRDSLEQKRIAAEQVVAYVKDRLEATA